MKGDFTRDTFNPAKRFLRVLRQQGRVELDADTNEQTAILLHYLQTLAADLIGPYGGPEANMGFAILPSISQFSGLTAVEKKALTDPQIKTKLGNLFKKRKPNTIDFALTNGRYYVDGVLCENDDYVLYSALGNYPEDDLTSDRANLLIYLDVWERTINDVEDPSIREVALGGADTSARTRVEWQIRVWPLKEDARERENAPSKLTERWQKEKWPDWVKFLLPPNRGRLVASVDNSEGQKGTDPCIIHPDARFRGPENQLYRVEIHQGGAAGHATFKWSRENGSVTFPILDSKANQARLAHLGRDNHLGLRVQDWVEMVDDGFTLGGKANPLFQIAEIEPIDFRVRLDASAGGAVKQYTSSESATRHAYLRRWDHKADTKAGGAVIVPDTAQWITLEDNIQIQFPVDNDAHYRAGDYWLIPARTTTGNIEWPRDEQGQAIAQPPHGIDHHLAPLAIWISATQITDVRLSFPKATGRGLQRTQPRSSGGE